MPQGFVDNFNVLLSPVQRTTVEVFLNVTRPALQKKYMDKKEVLSSMKFAELTELKTQWVKRITESKENGTHWFQLVTNEWDKRIQEIDNLHKKYQELAEDIDEAMILELEMAYSDCIGSVLRHQLWREISLDDYLPWETTRQRWIIPNFGNEERRSDGSIFPALWQ